jgi:hypothetical protein
MIYKKFKSLDDFIFNKYPFYDSINNNNKISSTIISSAWIGLLLLTQSTNKEQRLTNIIIRLGQTLEPLVKPNILSYNLLKFNTLLDENDSIHNYAYDNERYVENIIMVCRPLEYILDWFTECDDCPEFNLELYAENYLKIKKEAKYEFENERTKNKKRINKSSGT